MKISSVGQYDYDANGNMTTRPYQGQNYRLDYDQENRLRVITRLSDNSVTARYVYDGDGKRVISVAGNTSTVYVGDLFEAVIGASDTPEDYTLDRGFTNRVYFPAIMQEDVTSLPITSGPEYHTHPAKPAGGILWRTYYYAGGQRVATRETTAAGMADAFNLLSDHLGSTTVTVDKNGTRTAELFYKAWGEIDPSRTVGTTPTLRRYTGQYQADTGLMFYQARFFDPYLNRWTQPDPIIQDPNNPQDYDRYAYVRNNPVNFNDPSGHDVGCPASNPACLGISGKGNSQEYKNYQAESAKYKSQLETYLKNSTGFAPAGELGINNLIPGLPVPYSPSRQCGKMAYGPTLEANPHSTQDTEGPKDEITGLGIGVNVSAGNPVTASNWSAGKDFIWYPKQKNITSYNYLGPGWTVGGGGNLAIYGIVVYNVNDKGDYTGFTNSVSGTVSALDVGVTGGYSWSGNIKAYYAGYAPGARLSVSGSNALYWVDWSLP